MARDFLEKELPNLCHLGLQSKSIWDPQGQENALHSQYSGQMGIPKFIAVQGLKFAGVSGLYLARVIDKLLYGNSDNGLAVLDIGSGGGRPWSPAPSRRFSSVAPERASSELSTPEAMSGD